MWLLLQINVLIIIIMYYNITITYYALLNVCIVCYILLLLNKSKLIKVKVHVSVIRQSQRMRLVTFSDLDYFC